MTRMPTLFDADEYVRTREPNPCVYVFGKGPAGKKCGTCVNLLRMGEGHSRRWCKCLLRRDPSDPSRLGGPKTDHRVRWNACAGYRDRDEAV